MDKEKAISILGDVINEDGLYSLGWYLHWGKGDSKATLDGEFDADELEAIAWWMKNEQ